MKAKLIYNTSDFEIKTEIFSKKQYENLGIKLESNDIVFDEIEEGWAD